MNQQNLSLKSSQNDVLSEQSFQEPQNSQETLTDFHVEYFCVSDPESKYHSPLFATKAQNDVVLLHIRQTFPTTANTENPISDLNKMLADKNYCLKSWVPARNMTSCLSC